MRKLVFFGLLTLCASGLADDAAKAADAEASRLADQLASKDDAHVLAALQEVVGVQHKRLVAPLAKLLRSKNPTVRTAAIKALGKRTTLADQKKAATALAARLRPLAAKGQEQKRPELMAVTEALHDLAQEKSIKALLDIKTGADKEVVGARTRAAANVPSKKAIDQLLGLWAKKAGGQGHKGAVQKALRYATGEKFPNLRAWQKWWRENHDTFDPIAAYEARKAGKNSRKKKGQGKRRKGRKKKDDA